MILETDVFAFCEASSAEGKATFLECKLEAQTKFVENTLIRYLSVLTQNSEVSIDGKELQ